MACIQNSSILNNKRYEICDCAIKGLSMSAKNKSRRIMGRRVQIYVAHVLKWYKCCMELSDSDKKYCI